MESKSRISRRNFLVTGAAATATAAVAGFPFVQTVKAQSDKPVRIGLVGCGNRGTGAVADAIRANPNVRLVAMADPFKDRIELSLKSLKDPNRRRGAMCPSSVPTSSRNSTNLSCRSLAIDSFCPKTFSCCSGSKAVWYNSTGLPSTA